MDLCLSSPASCPARDRKSRRDALVTAHLPLVRTIARVVYRTSPRYLTVDDLIGHGSHALLLAAERFDPSRGVKFGSYAKVRVHGAMLDALRAETANFRPGGQPTAEFDEETPSSFTTRTALSDATVSQAAAEDDPFDAIAARRLRADLLAAIDRLPPRLRDFTRAHYFAELPLHEIGRQLGASKFTMHRLRNAAVREMSSILTTRHRPLTPAARVRLQ